MILVGRAVAPVWDVQRSSGGGIHLTKKLPYVNHYSFHIWTPSGAHHHQMAGHPPFGTQIILNGHEYVACPGHQAPSQLHKEDKLLHFRSPTPQPGQDCRHLVRSTDCGRLVQVCERWIYSRASVSRSASGAGADRLPLRLLGVSSRIQSQPTVSSRQSTRPGLSSA